MTQYERWVASHYLSEYPRKVSFEKLCLLIEKGSDKVLVWQPFEYWDGETLAGQMSSDVNSLEMTFTPKKAKCK